jgi:hypothetical protein
MHQIRQIDHVQLAMPAGEEAKARAFYSGLLGIPEVDKPAHLAARGDCWFERGVLKIHLGVDPDFVAARKAHPAFIVKWAPFFIMLFVANPLNQRKTREKRNIEIEDGPAPSAQSSGDFLWIEMRRPSEAGCWHVLQAADSD